MTKSLSWKRILTLLFVSILGGLLIGALIPLLIPIGVYLPSLLAGSLVSFITLFVLDGVWLRSGGGKTLFWMMLTAFFLRFALGIFLTIGLPEFGYPEVHQLDGYFFPDAFNRDGQAWMLASSGRSILAAFSGEFVNDQYGGLLGLSALIYRLFSPDAHRPYLVMIVSAGVSALGLPFFVKATTRFASQKHANLMGWVLALFPETLLLGATQMREPFIITAFAAAFWAVSTWFSTNKKVIRVAGFMVASVTLLLISSRSALPLLAFLIIWVWIEISARTKKKWLKFGGWALAGIFALLAVVASWGWLKEVMQWDILLAYRGSGWIELIFDTTPEWLHAPFIIVYGIFQPVLPAAIVDPAPWLWRVIGILRGLGWYAILPFLVYGFVAALKCEDRTRKNLLFWMAIAVWVWVILSSARAGGDQWDNPRYRMFIIPWMGVMAAYVLTRSKVHQNRWFWRWVLIEGIFLAFFTHWYISRYTGIFTRLPFAWMVGLIIGLSGLVMIFGWLRDRKRQKTGLDSKKIMQ